LIRIKGPATSATLVECTQLAKTAPTPDKRALYLRMASVWHQMAVRWEMKRMRRSGDSRTRRIAANIAELPELLRQRSEPNSDGERMKEKPRRWRAAGSLE